NLDPHMQGIVTYFATAYSFSRVLRLKVGPEVNIGDLIPVGDLATGWEQPDDVTYIFKLRPNVKWQNIPPANGRTLTAQDVVWSWQRQVDLKTNASYLGDFQKIEAV